jgi:hypothetical protein
MFPHFIQQTINPYLAYLHLIHFQNAPYKIAASIKPDLFYANSDHNF